MRRANNTITGLFWGMCCSSAIFVFLSFGFLISRPESGVSTGVVAGAATSPADERGALIAYTSLSRTQDFIPFDASLVTADSLIVLDVKTGETLLEKNSRTKHAIASVSKLLTATLLFERGFLPDAASGIPEKNNREILARWGVTSIAEGDAISGISTRPGDTFRAADLLKASLIASANNATYALVESQGIGPEEFPQEMQRLLGRMRIQHTTLFEPAGLSEHNVSTAQDIAQIAKQAFSYADIRFVTQEKESEITSLEGNTYAFTSTNELLKTTPMVILGGKTGYLDQAKYTYVILTKHITGREVVLVLLGSESSAARFAETEAIVHWLNRSYY